MKAEWVGDEEEQLEREFFGALVMKLKAGAALTPGEREILVGLIRNRPKPKHRRGRPTKVPHWMGLYCLQRESIRGEPAKVVVTEIVDRYGVSRAAVYAARRKQLLSK